MTLGAMGGSIPNSNHIGWHQMFTKCTRTGQVVWAVMNCAPNNYCESRVRKRLGQKVWIHFVKLMWGQKVWIHFVKLMWGRAGGGSACSRWEAEAVRRGHPLVQDICEGGLI